MAISYAFGGFQLEPRERRLTRGDDLVHLEPKSFDVLNHLLLHAGSLVSKQELVDAVWSGSIVTDNSLTRCIHQIRAALGDDAERPTFIETVPGSGYRFVAGVRVVAEPRSELVKALTEPHRARSRIGVALGIAALVAIGAWFLFRAADTNPPSIERIAVLPLANLTGDPEQLYLVMGVHDALITELSRIEVIDVISRTSVMRYRETELTIPEIATQLDVDAIVEGSVSRDGESLTVTAQLIATTPERHLWAQRFHRGANDVFEITTEIAKAVAAEIAVNLGVTQDIYSATNRRVKAEAYDAYLLGRFHFGRRNQDGFVQAQRHLQRALDIDPDFAPAYVALADTFGSATVFGMRKPADTMPMARSLAEMAVRIDSTLAAAHLTLARVSFYWQWDWAAAEAGARRALGLNPSSAESHNFLAEVLSVTGRHEEALLATQRARRLDPFSPITHFKPSLTHYLNRDFREAADQASAALQFYPNFWQGHWLVCLSLSELGEHEAAVGACERSANASGRTAMALGALGYVYARAGRRDEAVTVTTELETLKARQYVGPAALAIVFGALGNGDRAFSELEQAYADRDTLLIHAESYAFFDPLRSDQRFRIPGATPPESYQPGPG